MKIPLPNFILLFVVLCCLISKPVAAAETTSNAVTTVYLIRHAEKVQAKVPGKKQDPALTEQGKLRAKNWAAFFSSVEFDRVYSTDTRRTRDTASVVAASQDQKIILYDAKTFDSEAFIQANLASKVLVVGHSNTIPDYTNSLIDSQHYKNLNESDYNKVFVVDIVGEFKQAKVFNVEFSMPLDNVPVDNVPVDNVPVDNVPVNNIEGE